MCSNALDMIKNMTDIDIANKMLKTSKRKLKAEANGIAWPEWLFAGDMHLLQSSSVTPDVVVVVAYGKGTIKQCRKRLLKH